MNKLLLGTTALVGASLLMAGGAYAAKPKGKITGNLEFTAGGSDQDIEGKAFGGSADAGSAGPSLGYAFRTNSEIRFNASGKTDAGMKWKAEVQLEADTNVGFNTDDDGNESVIDESWIRFSGSWGQIILGNQDGVEDMYLTNDGYAVGKAGDGGTDGNWQDFIDARPVNSRLFDQPDGIIQSSDATKISYFTPRIGGLSAGVSWTPNTESHGQAIGTSDDSNKSTNNFAFGVKYKGKFDKVNVQVSGVVFTGDVRDETLEDPLSWAAGIGLGFGGWKAAFGYMDNGDSLQKKIETFDNDATAWSAGIGYSQGPVHLGVSWLHSEVEIDASDDDESDVVIFGASYALGGGARVFTDIFWLDQDSGEDPVGTENEGVGFLVGAQVKW
jgi:hypothetical protein